MAVINPVKTKSITMPKKRGRQRLPATKVVKTLIEFAEERSARKPHTKGSCAWYIALAVELAQLNKFRGYEIWLTTDADIWDIGLYNNRAKKSNDSICAWNDRHKRAVKMAVMQYG